MMSMMKKLVQVKRGSELDQAINRAKDPKWQDVELILDDMAMDELQTPDLVAHMLSLQNGEVEVRDLTETSAEAIVLVKKGSKLTDDEIEGYLKDQAIMMSDTAETNR